MKNSPFLTQNIKSPYENELLTTLLIFYSEFQNIKKNVFSEGKLNLNACFTNEINIVLIGRNQQYC